MSVHPSLKTVDTMKRHRSVLSRLERVKVLQGKGAFSPREHSVLGLPKVKHLRIRVKKEKAAATPEQAAAGAATSPAASAPATQEAAKPKK